MSILKIKDSQGNWISVPTLKGDKGNGIQSAVLNNDYTLTLDFTDGTSYTTPSIRGEKGEQGEPATDMEIHICSVSEYDSETRIPTIVNPDDKTFYLVPTEDGTSPDLFTEWVYVNNAWEMFGSMKIDLSGYLTDVTVDGTSVVTDGVANIHTATSESLGVVKVDAFKGIYTGANDGILRLSTAGNGAVKAGLDSVLALKPTNQHYATFYGLAKAAGADEKNSTLAFGTYSDNAKSSIQNMLGITDKYSPKEWVAESETELVTNAHSVGDLFYIGETLYKVIADLKAGDAVNVGVNVEEVNANDILDDYATKEDVQDNISIVEKSASGSIASFDDGMDNMPLKSLTVDINPVQDLHGYDSPWVGGGGKNLLDPSILKDQVSWNVIDMQLKPSTAYTMSSNCPSTNGLVTYFTTDGLQPSNRKVSNGYPVTQTSDENGIIKVIQRRASGEESFSDYQFQVEEGSTATSWTPYENICPISGWTGCDVVQTGKNLFDKNSYLSYKGYFEGSEIVYNVGHLIVYIPCKPNTTYTVNRQRTVTNERFAVSWTKVVPSSHVAIYNKKTSTNTGTVGDWMSLTITTGEDAKYLAVWAWWNSSVNPENTLQIELGSTRTDYSAYTGRSITISLGQTVYGGKLDVLSGVLRIDRLGLDGGDLSWTKVDNYNYGNFYTLPTPLASYVTTRPTVISSSYKSESNQSASSTNDCYVWIRSVSVGIRRIYVKDTSKASMTAEEFGTAMTGVQFVYELVTPIEIQLTPHEINSLLGANNIFADTGDTSVEYFSQVDEDLIDYIETSLKPYAKEERLNDYVSDVQVNGTSIVTNNVANVPVATRSVIGALYTASEADGKVGTHTYRAIVPQMQHSSVFYGLAKAAGDTTQSASDNTVGTYTDEAKTAIKQMLGIHDTIDSFIEEVTGTDVTITGQPSYRYNCGELYSLTVTPPSSGTIDIRFTSGSSPTVLTLPSTVKMPEWWVEVEANTIYEMCITDGIYCGVMTWAI